MKIRQGFVSNSSSTSFCLYGTVVEPEDIIKYCRKLELDYKYDAIDALTDKLGLSYHQAYQESDSYVIGRSHADMDSDQTRKQFEEEIQEKLKQLDPEIKCSLHEGGWYDG
jgi:hypothetical protein